MKRISLQLSTLLAALFLFAFSCQDHYVPEEPEPETLKIRTLPIESPTDGEYSRTRFGMAIEKLGNQAIKKFGMIISTHSIGSNNYTTNPTIANQKLSINEAATIGEHSFVEASFDRDEYVEVFYRAYAEQTNGDVVYGEVFKYTPADIVSIRVTNLSGNKAPIEVDLDITYLGAIEVEEYGVVYSYKVNVNDPVTPNPTLADHKIKSAVALKLGKQTIGLPIPGNSVIQIYTRPYVKYKNGNVFYGNISS
ncbi:hypothetical protein [Dyadobacter chenhuakuii]|uniref:DUF4397 domain-containing protein n=1 Tax=Dyadobacter chenhuakuii TaxID=2909339 RepID=A0A9X1QDA8_9BACT|nr:hypothetical protein [Dyadobacter chenhuakuii]MCF2499605.1 hypothetical protein [Dyadobacter chenhuakuii]